MTATEFATVLGDHTGPAVSTTEHVLAALYALGVDNAVVEMDGPEVPIMDGSAAPFVAAIDQVGIETLSAPRRYIQVLKPIRVGKNGCHGELRPHLRGLRIETEIEFDHPLIGRQTLAIEVEPDVFRRELARARTFGFMRDVAKLWSAGYALGASFENTVVAADNRILNAEGMRFPDECVRHKAVDAIGDLALAGAPLHRRLSFRARRPQAQSRGALGADGRSFGVDLCRDARSRAPCARPRGTRRRFCGAGLRPRRLLIRWPFSP